MIIYTNYNITIVFYSTDKGGLRTPEGDGAELNSIRRALT